MELNDENFLKFAMKHYDNPQAKTLEEFQLDLNRFSTVKKLFSRSFKDGEPRVRLVLNHIITLFNIFGYAAKPMLYHRVDCKYHASLNTFMLYINRITVEEALELDQSIVDELRKL
jgi:hypothetical protein